MHMVIDLLEYVHMRAGVETGLVCNGVCKRAYIMVLLDLIIRVGQNYTFIIYRYIRCIYNIFGREITIHTVIYGVYIRSGQPYS
jgi:hypothetical protein